jgi:AcrR family transcriptional regulator
MDAQDKTIERRRTERPTAEAILAAACRAIVRRGVEATRIADIAREAGTSTGTVHYYFETKDDVLLAALESANDQPYARMDELLGQEADDLSRLATLLELSIPYPGPQREEWVFFLELWGRMRPRAPIRGGGATSSTSCVPGRQMAPFDRSPPRMRSRTDSSRSSTALASRPFSEARG